MLLSKNIGLKQFRNVFLLGYLVLGQNLFVDSFLHYLFFIGFLAFSFLLGLKRIEIHNTSHIKLMLVFCFCVIISSLTSAYFSAESVVSAFQMVTFMVFVLVFNFEDIKYVLERYFKILTVVIIIGVFYSGILYLFGNISYNGICYDNYISVIPYFRQLGYGMSTDIGYSSFYTNPNVFSFHIILVLMWTVCTQGVHFSWRNVFLFATLLLGLKLANSRAGYIIAVFVLVLYWFFNKKPKTKKILVIGLIVSLIVLIFILNVYSDRVNFSIDLTGRNELWNKLWYVIKENSVFGIGFSNSVDNILGGTTSHNSYITLLVETGIVGVSVFALAILSVFDCIIKINKKSIVSDKFLFTSMVAFLVYIVYSLIENVIFVIDGKYAIWLLFGSYISIYLKKQNSFTKEMVSI